MLQCRRGGQVLALPAPAVQLDMRRRFDAQGMKPGMKVKLILTR
jgi:hypothetical protein